MCVHMCVWTPLCMLTGMYVCGVCAHVHAHMGVLCGACVRMCILCGACMCVSSCVCSFVCTRMRACLCVMERSQEGTTCLRTNQEGSSPRKGASGQSQPWSSGLCPLCAPPRSSCPSLSRLGQAHEGREGLSCQRNPWWQKRQRLLGTVPLPYLSPSTKKNSGATQSNSRSVSYQALICRKD